MSLGDCTSVEVVRVCKLQSGCTALIEFVGNTAYHESMKGFGAIEWLARGGFLVKGVLYMVIGALALQVAARAGGRLTGTRGALTAVLGQPFGRTLLLVAVIGFLGYAAWRVLQGLFDPDRLGHNWSGLAIRASFVARGVVHGCWAGRYSAYIVGCRPYRGPASVRSPLRRSGGRSVIGW